MADVLENCAVDSSHQPAIYAAFIREIVRKTRDSRRAPTPPADEPAYDPQLMADAWHPGTDIEAAQFTFVPQGGDMM